VDFTTAIEMNGRLIGAYVSRGKAFSDIGDMPAARSDWAMAGQLLHQSH
jgi:hypothetical protein